MGSADNAFAALNRFEETVSKEEATAKAFDQLAPPARTTTWKPSSPQLGGHSVDAELAALKAERQAAPEAAAAAAVSAQGAGRARRVHLRGRAGRRRRPRRSTAWAPSRSRW